MINHFEFLRGGGEMGERIRQFNWANTPLGNPETWPNSLRVSLSILLHNKFPMLLFWGKDYIQFYNDAIMPDLVTTGKHPTALGQSGRACWEESWHVLSQQLDQVRESGEGIWKEDELITIHRNGKTENTYWTFSYSPVFDDHSNVIGILSTALETTKKVVGIARLKEHTDELSSSIEAAELCTWDLDLLSGNFSANARLKEWIGIDLHKEVTLAQTIDAIAEADKHRVTYAIDKAMAYDSGGRYESVYTIINPQTKRQRIVLAKGRVWFHSDRKPYRFNGTLQDITDQKLLEIAQKEVEERFRNVSNTSPTGLWLSNPQGGLVYLNKTLTDWTGIAYEDLLGTGWSNAIIEEDREHAVKTFLTALSLKKHYEVEFRIRKANGTIVWCRAEGDPFYDKQGNYGGYAGYCMDNQELKAMTQSLEQSRQLLLSSFEEAPVAISIVDDKLVYTMANLAYGELVGRKPAELIGKHLIEALPELAGQGFDRLLEDVITSGKAYKSKEVAADIIRNGELKNIYVNFTYQPHFDSNRKVTGVLMVATEITEQVLARRRTEESEAKFKSLIEEAPVATCLFVGPEMKIEIANDIMLGYWGKDKNVLGLPLEEALPELEGQPFLKILDNVYTTGVAHAEQNAKAQLVVNNQLQTFYFDYTYKPLKNAFGKTYAIMDMAVDVTEQVISRKKLEESERFARHIFYNSPVAKLVYTGENMILQEANEAMLKIFGRDESILKKPIMESIPELKQTDLLQKYRKVLQTGEAHYEHAQRILLIKNGEKYWGYYDYIYKPLINSSDQIFGVVCTAVDVTQEVTARQQIEAAEASLRNAIELAELATWEIDFIQGKNYYSPRLQEWIGAEKADLNIEASPRIHPKDQNRIGAAIKQAMNPESGGHFEATYTIVHPITLKERIIHSSGRTIFDEHKNAIGMRGTAQDVTLQQQLQKELEAEVKQRTEQLEHMNENLRHSNEELSQYAYVASHDLQEPLRKIQVFSSILNDNGGITGENKVYLEKISRSAERMSLLIKDLLEFSRLLKSDNIKQQTDLNKVVNEIMTDFELLIEEKKAVIHLDPLPTIEAVGLQMDQLFHNLLSNALKFTKTDTAPFITITSRLLTTDEIMNSIRKPLPGKKYHKISIADNGIGFDSTYTDQIFEVFKRLHSRDTFAGSGIGLALCKRIIINHEGDLSCESVIDQGSTFHIVLPE